MNKNRIRELREAHGYTQNDLAIKLGVSRVAVTRWESGKSSPKTSLLPSLSRILGCSIDDLFLANV